MPFTFSHPAIILPFGLFKRKLSFTGLVAGSLVPDFEYFIRMNGLSLYGHDWWGILWFDLPLALFICFTYHNLVRNYLLQSMPPVVLLRSVPYFDFKWNRWFSRKWLVVIVSILIGSASHLLWDLVTHETSNSLLGVPYLNRMAKLSNDEFLIYYLFWSLNSLTGAALILFAFFKLPLQKKWKRTFPANYYWFLNASIFSIIFLCRMILSDGTTVLFYTDSAISSILISLILSSVCMRLTNFRQAKILKETSSSYAQ